jgi:hypothetical protein
MERTLTGWPVRLPACAALIFSGCGQAGDAARQAAVEGFAQSLDIEIEGSTVSLPLEGLSVYLAEDGRPEIFAIEGPGLALAGTLPGGVRVGYEENWQVLVGQAIPIAPRGGDPADEKESFVTIPGAGPLRVLGGSFTFESVQPGWDAKTPLSGSIELRVRGMAGETMLRGRIAVKGTTWG